MGFHEIRFPDFDDWKTLGGPGNASHTLRVDSGDRRVIQRWGEFLWRFDVAQNVRSYADLEQIRDFYLARGGVANGFRYKFWGDFSSTPSGRLWGEDDPPAVSATDQTLGVGDGSQTTFQLVKRYTSGDQSFVRRISKPVEGTVLLSIDDTPTASGWTVNTTTGLVTFSSAPALGEVVKSGFEFDVPVAFAQSLDELLGITLDDFSSGSVSSIPLEEILVPARWDEDRFNGGSKTVSIAANASADFSALLWIVNPTAGGPLKLTLPDLEDVPNGGPLLVVKNVSGTNSLDVRSFSDLSILTLAAGEAAEFYHGTDTGGLDQWFAWKV